MSDIPSPAALRLLVGELSAQEVRAVQAYHRHIAGWYRAHLARTREDALREAAEVARQVPIPDDACASEAHGRISTALEASLRILALITKPAPERKA